MNKLYFVSYWYKCMNGVWGFEHVLYPCSIFLTFNVANCVQYIRTESTRRLSDDLIYILNYKLITPLLLEVKKIKYIWSWISWGINWLFWLLGIAAILYLIWISKTTDVWMH